MSRPKRQKSGPTQKQRKENDQDRKRLRRFLFIYVPIIFIVLFLIYALAFDPVRHGSEIQKRGVLLETTESTSGGTVHVAYKVQLSGGQVVMLNGYNGKSIDKKKEVLVEESETLLFGRKLYQLVRFVD